MKFPTIIIKTPINLKIISNGISFVPNTVSAILMTREARDRIKIDSVKENFLNYLKEYKEAYTSEIMEKFDLNLREVDLLLNRLKSEGKIQVR